MSQENLLDRNRIKEMIRAALLQDRDKCTELGRMAGNLKEPIDALAAFLVGDVKPSEKLTFRDEVTQDDGSTRLPCTRKQWEYFLGLCRDASKKWRSCGRIEIQAKIGQWPNTFDPSSALKRFLTESGCVSVWGWTWSKDRFTTGRFFDGIAPSLLEPETHAFGYEIAEGLCLAIRRGDVTVPNEKRITFALAYAKWFGSHTCLNGNIAELAAAMRLNVAEVSDEDLQALAIYWRDASRELGRRRIPLAIPVLQNKQEWIHGAFFSLMNEIRKLSLESAAKRFVATSDPIERYWIASEVCGDRKVVNPEDIFGPKVSQFWLLTGKDDEAKKPREITYEEAVQYYL